MSFLLYYFVNSRFASLNRVIKKSILATPCIFNEKFASEYIKIPEHGCTQHFGTVSAITGLENSASEMIFISSACVKLVALPSSSSVIFPLIVQPFIDALVRMMENNPFL